MDLKLAGKVALVTGARTGIGFSICAELAANGVHLVMVARQKAELILAAQKIADKYGVTVLPIAGDVTDPELPELADKTDKEVMALLGKEKTPVGRFGLPEDIAAITAFLLSDRNQFVTGQTIEASGGADRFM